MLSKKPFNYNPEVLTMKATINYELSMTCLSTLNNNLIRILTKHKNKKIAIGRFKRIFIYTVKTTITVSLTQLLQFGVKWEFS